MSAIHEHLMATYRKLTGVPLDYHPMWHDSPLFLFLKKFDADDLALVVKHIKKRYAEKPEYIAQMLRFKFLIVQLDRFAELLAEAQAASPRGLTNRDKVLMASGREPERKPEQEPKHPKEVLQRMAPAQLSEGWKAILASLDQPPQPEQENPF